MKHKCFAAVVLAAALLLTGCGGAAAPAAPAGSGAASQSAAAAADVYKRQVSEKRSAAQRLFTTYCTHHGTIGRSVLYSLKSLESVSYTHLDVYKRQGYTGGRVWGGQGGTDAAPDLRRGKAAAGQSPVSYTHLDVYKRQQ